MKHYNGSYRFLNGERGYLGEYREALKDNSKLLNVLNMISRDLAEISRALKAMSGPAAATPPERIGSMEEAYFPQI
jgi:hypothetical protein